MSTIVNMTFPLRHKIIAKSDHYTKRKIREKIEIKLHLKKVNRDERTKINETWNPLF